VFWFAFYGSCTCSAVVGLLYVVLSPLANKDIHTQLMQACGPHVLRDRTAGVSVSRDARSGWDFRTISRGRGGCGGSPCVAADSSTQPTQCPRHTQEMLRQKGIAPRAARRYVPPPPTAVRRWHIVSAPIRPSASVHGRGGSTSISGGQRWLSCRQPACL